MPLTDVLRDDEQRVDELIKAAGNYLKALRGWKKACQTGHLAEREKFAQAAGAQVQQLVQPALERADAWRFDERQYFESGAWLQELQAECVKAGLTTLTEDDALICPPVVVRAQAGRRRLMLGRQPWPTLDPVKTAGELKRLADQAASTPEMQRFLNHLYDASKRALGPNGVAKLRDVYELFALAPGWKKENPEASFARQIYALHHHGRELRTRDGKAIEYEEPSGRVKDRDIFSVISHDGNLIRYYGIRFR
jgi:hypothetical protein